MGIIMCIAQVANINVNWLITIIGIWCGSAVPPLWCVLSWRRATGKAAVSGESPPALSTYNLIFQCHPMPPLWCVLSWRRACRHCCNL
jgi:hypothetical protein